MEFVVEIHLVTKQNSFWDETKLILAEAEVIYKLG